MSFDQNGKLLTSGTTNTLVASGFAWSDGASGNPITVSFANSTNYSATDGVSSVNADGFGIGQLNNLSIGADGTVQGIYSNGQTWTLGKVTLTNFASPQGLQRAGNNYYVPTAASGQPVTGTPSNNGLGVLQSNAVEESNVDLSTQLVDLIVAQQAYQANSQTIKTENQVVQTLLSL
jgi:flagellar hook protein FlgE